MFTRFALFLMWLLHWLPYPFLRGTGNGLGLLLYPLVKRRRRIAETNLRLCFPELSEAERNRLVRRHFMAFGRSFVDRSLLWWASPARLKRLIRLRNPERLQDPAGRPTILLAPHFVGLDAAGSRVSMEISAVSVYSAQKNAAFDRVLLAGRQRFNTQILLSRQDGMRKALKALKDGHPFYYLPDMDFGARDAVFVPFFGVPAATITGVSRLARVTGARIVPCIARMVADGYEVELQEPWADFPGESVEADTERMNAYLETQVRRMPEQYYWVHRRFKTRPPGEPGFY